MEEKSDDRFIGKILGDRYEILEKIGEGGMSVVYKARCTRLNRNVAVKILNDDARIDETTRRKFQTESQAVAKLSHPNIISVYDVSTGSDVEYIVMELVDGITLRQYMDKKVFLSWKETLFFSKQVAKALVHAHEKGIIHRDIKPQNLMLLRDGTVKVADFGIAVLENEVSDEEGQAIGSIHYIAPEQARGNTPDARSDIYSLGIVMYEMLTGIKPFDGSSLGEIAVKHMTGETEPIEKFAPDAPRELIKIIYKAISPELEKRYSSAAEMLDAMEMFTRAHNAAAQLGFVKPVKPITEEEAERLIKPVKSVSELSKDKYILRKKRAGRVSFSIGALAALLSILMLFVFVWRFWLSEVFSPAQRIDLPDFIGFNYNSLLKDKDIVSLYNFKVTYVVDTSTDGGVILSQDPAPGRSMMVSTDGIDVKLSVSTGYVLSSVADVTGYEYKEAVLILQKSGFKVEVETVTSDSVEKDKVISTSPSAGEQISAGSTVYLMVSAGDQLMFVDMPNLVGLSEEAAISKLQRAGLTFGGSERQASEYEAGTVISQSPNSFAQVEEHSKIYLVISTGPNV